MKCTDELFAAAIKGWFKIAPPGKITRALPEISDRDKQSILVVATTALGDAVCCLPLIASLRAALPNARIGFFIKRNFSPLFLGHPALTEIIEYPGKYRGMRRVICQIRAGGYRTALLCNMNDPDVVPLLLFGGVTCFLRRPSRTTAFAEYMANSEDAALEQVHAVDGALELGKRLGISPVTETPSLSISQTAAGLAEDEISRHGLSGKSLIGLHPGSYFSFKRWEEKSYSELLKRLSGYGCVILTGNDVEQGICQDIVARAGVAAVNLAGSIPIDVTAALIQKMKLLVSPDTGVAHIAFALDTPTVTLYFANEKEMAMNRPRHHLDRHRTLFQPKSADEVHVECLKLM